MVPFDCKKIVIMKNQIQDDDQRCALCDGTPEDILMLECNHDICVDCALKGYLKNKNPQNSFTCGLCQKKTLLDKQTIKFLIAAQEQKQAKIDQKLQRSPHIPKVPKQKSSRKLCVEHKEQLIYYCFDCETQDICSECILNQKHASHNVSTLKKAVQKYKNLMINQLKEKQTTRIKLENNQRMLKELNSNFKSQIQSKKKQIKYYFESLKKIIDNHYERLSAQFSEMSQQSQNFLAGEISRCHSNIEILKQDMTELSRGINTSEQLSVLKKIKYKSTPDVTFKVDALLPEFEYSDISSELHKKLGTFAIVDQHGEHQNLQSRQKINEFNDHLQVPYGNQTRIRNSMNSSHASNYKQSFVQTPMKPSMQKSINTASDLINRLQSRQRSFG